jgi:hypothetical protein
MRKKTGHGLEAMERNLEIKGGLLKTFPFEIAKFMLDPLQGGHDSGAINGGGTSRIHGLKTPLFTHASANNRRTLFRFDTIRQVLPLDSISEAFISMPAAE